ncbi:enoyl-CoA hydratase/isomerase family protein [Noviherbaspirillum pedocola]|uniref:Enoyl-CoA hydratase/isomerase family protein n=1 Tax=Noviherbaspirillum pedocola TaxID=2801341 RepID=A0A934W6S2_9BURK|nr:enoyl-CoA hydratase/isomerase family protein [Noviherbaspirillum pedocola]MBK4733854.1 enoyl-CoA hydratase/isomerase family protein [Noviherbaspirillum pedocola]
MTAHVLAEIQNRIGILTLDRSRALNALSLDMVRAISAHLRAWRDDDSVLAVLIRSSSERAFCAGGDIRFFHEVGNAAPAGGSALLEDFFTEEYALNHLIHHYPKPYIALLDGIVMGGGMGITQAGKQRLAIVTERTRMAMPEVHIGLFPDVGGSHFLTRMPGQLGRWLALSGETISAADALHANLADVFLPAALLPELMGMLGQHAARDAADIVNMIREFAAPHVRDAGHGRLADARERIDRLFAADTVSAIVSGLKQEGDDFAAATLHAMERGSPLMLCVTLEQLRRGAGMSLAECLRMERDMVRHCFERTEVLEGIRARVIEKDNAPRWSPASLADVDEAMVTAYFEPVWPAHMHPLREL